MWILSHTVTSWLSNCKSDTSENAPASVKRRATVLRATPVNRVASHMFYKAGLLQGMTGTCVLIMIIPKTPNTLSNPNKTGYEMKRGMNHCVFRLVRCSQDLESREITDGELSSLM